MFDLHEYVMLDQFIILCAKLLISMTNTQVTTERYERGYRPGITTVGPHCGIGNGTKEVLTVVFDCKCRTISPVHQISNEQLTARPDSVSSVMKIKCRCDMCFTIAFKPTSSEATPSTLDLSGSKSAAFSSREGSTPSAKDLEEVPTFQELLLLLVFGGCMILLH
jgi:hypothetical protein